MPFSSRRDMIVLLLGLLLPRIALANELERGSGAITYISSEAIYVNAGRLAGLEKGTVVRVVRDGTVVAVLEVTTVSSHSAACRLVEQDQPPRVGDAIRFDAAAPPVAPAPLEVRHAPSPRPETTVPTRVSRVSGYVSLQNHWLHDMSGDGVSSLQPALMARLVVRNVLGDRGTLRMRYHSRLYHRSVRLSDGADVNEWRHYLSEFALEVHNPDEPFELVVGRLVNPYLRGVGFVDGGYATRRLGGNLRAGIGAGLEPDIETSAPQLDRQAISLFGVYERGAPGRDYFASTLALSGSYAEGTISREFGYVQNTLSIASRLSLHQSVEIDFNRGWRKDAAESSLSFTNLFVSGQLSPARFARFSFSYDDRNNVRDYDTFQTPDSLFDIGSSRGFMAGASFYLPSRIRIRGTGGMRYDADDVETNRYWSLLVNVGRLPIRGHSINFLLSRSQTPIVTGYRPVLSYRLPVGPHSRLAISTGAYLYDTDMARTASYYVDVMNDFTFLRRYFFSGAIRQYFGDSFESFQLYTELGINL